MRAIVMAGGLGTRLRPYTDVIPKPLLPLDGTPMLEILLRQLRYAGFDHITLALHYRAEQFKALVGDGSWLGLRIDYSVADRLLGTAGPLGLIERPEEPCLVVNADVLTNVDYGDVMAHHRRRGTIASIVLCRLAIDIPFGVVDASPGGTVDGYREKPTHEVLVNAGIYVLDPEAWDHVPPSTHLDMSTLIERGLAKGRPISTYVHIGDWIDIGTVDQYHAGIEVFRRHRARYLPELTSVAV